MPETRETVENSQFEYDDVMGDTRRGENLENCVNLTHPKDQSRMFKQKKKHIRVQYGLTHQRLSASFAHRIKQLRVGARENHQMQG